MIADRYSSIIVNKDWNGIIDSHYLFSSIVKSIGECAQQVQMTPKKQQPKKNFKRNPNNKFQKRFNLGGSGLESAQKPAQQTKSPSSQISNVSKPSRLGTPSTNSGSSAPS